MARRKFAMVSAWELNRSQTMIIWDPAKCAINDEMRNTDYCGPAQ